MNRCVWFVLALLAVAAPRAHAEAAVQGTPQFGAEAIAVLGDSLRTVAVVRVSVPYDEMLFAKFGSEYRAACEITVEIRGKDRRPPASAARTVRASVASYAETQQDTLHVETSDTFPVAPGEYVVEIHVRDLESGSRASLKMPLTVENLRARSGTLSPLTLGQLRPGVDPAAATVRDVLPHPTRVFGTDAPLTAIAGEVYLGADVTDTSRVDTVWTLGYRFLDENGDLRLRGTKHFPRTGVATPFVLTPNLAWLSLGSYTLEVETVGRGSTRTVAFEADESYVDLDHDYARLVAMVSYIATGREQDSFRTAVTIGDRTSLWERFWSRRRLDPETPQNVVKSEFFRRVRQANTLYHSAGMEGWRTDRGRIYIKFGAPDQVDETPVTAFQPAYQVWRYYSARTVFVFADRDGFGRYVLVSANRPE